MLFEQDIMLSERHIKLFGRDIICYNNLIMLFEQIIMLSERDIKLFGRDIKLL